MKTNKTLILGLALAVALGGLLSVNPESVRAAATINPVATTMISSDSAVSSSVNLPAFTISEGSAGDIALGTLSWALPAGYVFDTSSPASVTYAGAGLAGSATTTFPDASHFNIEINSTSSVASTVTVGSVTPLKVKAAAGTPLAASGNLILASGSIDGVSSNTNFGTLTQTPGAATKLVFTVQPSTAILANSGVINATVAVKDQFGNTVISDSGRTVNLSPLLASTGTLGSLMGTTNINTKNGLAVFNNLAYNQTGIIQLQAQSSGLTSATSNQITISLNPVPTTTNLPNGILVKFPGDPTIYMVVNGILRPFTSPAIFHARGKKFKDVRELENEHANRYTIGRPIGQSNDDSNDDNQNTTGNSSTTTPASAYSPGTLPEGSVVKVPGNPTVYIVINGQLQAIPSLEVFKAWRKNFQDIQVITDTQLQNMTVAGVAGFPDGTLIKGSGPTIYVVKNGQLYGIPSLKVIKKHNYKLQNLIRIQDREMVRYQIGGIED